MADAGDARAWSVRRRPPARFRAWSALIAVILGVAGGGLMRLLMLEPAWPAAIAMGVGIAALSILTAWRGAAASVDAAGVLRYGWGAAPALEVDLREVLGVRPVRAGMLAGVGLDVPVAAVRFLHRKGPSPQRMRDDRERLGVDLVLEFLTPDDGARLDAMRRTLRARPLPAEPSPN